MAQRLLFALVCLFFLSPAVVAEEKGKTTEPTLRAVGYYVALRATIIFDQKIDLFGNSNLPSGSILGVHVYDFTGMGSQIFNEDTNIVLGRSGIFRVEIHAKKGKAFRRNMICDVVFAPTYPRQPEGVLNIVGKTGEHLGKWHTNPQLEGSPRVTTLAATTVVR